MKWVLIAAAGIVIVGGIVLTVFLWARGPSDEEVSFLRAARAGDLATIQRMTESDPQLVNCHGRGRVTPLHEAAFGGAIGRGQNLEVIRYLLDHGADVTARTTSGETVMQWAAPDGGMENFEIQGLLMQKFLEAGGARLPAAKR